MENDSHSIAEQLEVIRTSLDVTSATFNEDVIRYTELLAESTKAIRAENAIKLNDAKSKLGAGINVLAESLNLSDLLVEKVTRIIWEYIPGTTDDDDDTIRVYINPTGRGKATTPRAASANGDRRDLTAIFDQHATDEDREKADEIDARLGPDGTEPDSKKRNSQLWSLKNRVAERASKESASIT
jgi:hypothetical protein